MSSLGLKFPSPICICPTKQGTSYRGKNVLSHAKKRGRPMHQFLNSSFPSDEKYVKTKRQKDKRIIISWGFFCDHDDVGVCIRIQRRVNRDRERERNKGQSEAIVCIHERGVPASQLECPIAIAGRINRGNDFAGKVVSSKRSESKPALLRSSRDSCETQ